VLFILHPGLIPLRGVAAMLLGWRSPADVLRWEPALGNLVLYTQRLALHHLFSLYPLGSPRIRPPQKQALQK
jgi:hypothetical protein